MKRVEKVVVVFLSMIFLIASVRITPVSAFSNENNQLSPLEIRPMLLPTELKLPETVISTQAPDTSGGSDGIFDNGWWGLNTISNNFPKGTVTFSSSKSFIPFTQTILKADSTVTEFDRATNVYDYARKGITFNGILDASGCCSLENGKGIMMYVKMSSRSKQFAIYFVTEKSNSWNLSLKTGGLYYLLSENSGVWTAYYGNDAELVDLPYNGFEGYVYIPKSTLSVNDNTDWNTDSIKRLQIQFGRYGGDEGAAYFSMPMIALDDPLSSSTSLLRLENGNEYPLFNNYSDSILTRTVTFPSEIDEAGHIISAEKAGTGSGGDNYYGGEWWSLSAVNGNVPQGNAELSTAYSSSPIVKNLLKLDSTAVEYDWRYNQEDNARNGIAVTAGFPTENTASLKDGTGIMMYVKMSSCSKSLAAYFIPEKSGSWSFRTKSGLPYYTLSRGGGEWLRMTGNSNELIELPYSGFEGYIYIPKSTLSYGDDTDWNTDSLKKIQIQFGRYGGDEGAVYFSLPIVTLNDPVAEKLTVSSKEENECFVKELFEYSTVVSGDVDMNSVINLKDLIILKKILLNTKRN